MFSSFVNSTVYDDEKYSTTSYSEYKTNITIAQITVNDQKMIIAPKRNSKKYTLKLPPPPISNSLSPPSSPYKKHQIKKYTKNGFRSSKKTTAKNTLEPVTNSMYLNYSNLQKVRRQKEREEEREEEREQKREEYDFSDDDSSIEHEDSYDPLISPSRISTSIYSHTQTSNNIINHQHKRTNSNYSNLASIVENIQDDNTYIQTLSDYEKEHSNAYHANNASSSTSFVCSSSSSPAEKQQQKHGQNTGYLSSSSGNEFDPNLQPLCANDFLIMDNDVKDDIQEIQQNTNIRKKIKQKNRREQERKVRQKRRKKRLKYMTKRCEEQKEEEIVQKSSIKKRNLRIVRIAKPKMSQISKISTSEESNSTSFAPQPNSTLYSSSDLSFIQQPPTYSTPILSKYFVIAVIESCLKMLNELTLIYFNGNIFLKKKQKSIASSLRYLFGVQFLQMIPYHKKPVNNIFLAEFANAMEKLNISFQNPSQILPIMFEQLSEKYLSKEGNVENAVIVSKHSYANWIVKYITHNHLILSSDQLLLNLLQSALRNSVSQQYSSRMLVMNNTMVNENHNIRNNLNLHLNMVMNNISPKHRITYHKHKQYKKRNERKSRKYGTEVDLKRNTYRYLSSDYDSSTADTITSSHDRYLRGRYSNGGKKKKKKLMKSNGKSKKSVFSSYKKNSRLFAVCSRY